MIKRNAKFIVIAMIFMLSGCGTLISSSYSTGSDRIYSGIRFNSAILSGEFPKGVSAPSGIALLIAQPFALLDFPFSFALDTVFLPFTLSAAAFETLSTKDTVPKTQPLPKPQTSSPK